MANSGIIRILIFIIILPINTLFPAGNDNKIYWGGVIHSPFSNLDHIIRENTYRYFDHSLNKTIFYLRTFKEDLTSADLIWKNGFAGEENVIEMRVGYTSDDDVGYDYWTCELPKQNIHEIFYVIKIADGKDVEWVAKNGSNENCIQHQVKPNKKENWWFFDDTLLRVELVVFEGSYKDNQIELVWETSSEMNNFGFEIERSVDNEDWIKIGFLEGFGSTSSLKEYFFVDKDILSDTYYYRLKQIGYGDFFEYSPIIEVEAESLAENIVLEQNYPNPFNPVTSIRFAVMERTFVELTVYNIIGDKIETLFRDVADGGRIYNLSFDGSGLASGIYFYRLSTDDKIEIKKMILVK